MENTDEKKIARKVSKAILYVVGGLLIAFELISIIGNLVTEGTTGLSLGSPNDEANFGYLLERLSSGILGLMLLAIGFCLPRKIE